ncbi:hypothetical protein PPERSA_00007 [Pseudocohnilembus persalinus]|uniref:Uncharacterized protein n=1 Tax=Pseudocohnilembus persalinus TaxID=266149 RepID=A0A0V0QUZ3_PSEPJ|nr:hypothetical protein PPERSA_00007 [Pseudocohnilembus persalinus]|eukprot:KRX06127.1 hypothetical protein PPERSA_00007 [Pseudocohnilembus persalinus]
MIAEDKLQDKVQKQQKLEVKSDENQSGNHSSINSDKNSEQKNSQNSQKQQQSEKQNSEQKNEINFNSFIDLNLEEQGQILANFENERRILLKKGRISGIVVKRYYIIQNSNLVYFQSENSKKARGVINLEGNTSRVLQKSGKKSNLQSENLKNQSISLCQKQLQNQSQSQSQNEMSQNTISQKIQKDDLIQNQKQNQENGSDFLSYQNQSFYENQEEGQVFYLKVQPSQKKGELFLYPKNNSEFFYLRSLVQFLGKSQYQFEIQPGIQQIQKKQEEFSQFHKSQQLSNQNKENRDLVEEKSKIKDQINTEFDNLTMNTEESIAHLPSLQINNTKLSQNLFVRNSQLHSLHTSFNFNNQRNLTNLTQNNNDNNFNSFSINGHQNQGQFLCSQNQQTTEFGLGEDDAPNYRNHTYQFENINNNYNIQNFQSIQNNRRNNQEGVLQNQNQNCLNESGQGDAREEYYSETLTFLDNDFPFFSNKQQKKYDAFQISSFRNRMSITERMNQKNQNYLNQNKFSFRNNLSQQVTQRNLKNQHIFQEQQQQFQNQQLFGYENQVSQRNQIDFYDMLSQRPSVDQKYISIQPSAKHLSHSGKKEQKNKENQKKLGKKQSNSDKNHPETYYSDESDIENYEFQLQDNQKEKFQQLSSFSHLFKSEQHKNKINLVKTRQNESDVVKLGEFSNTDYLQSPNSQHINEEELFQDQQSLNLINKKLDFFKKNKQDQQSEMGKIQYLDDKENQIEEQIQILFGNGNQIQSVEKQNQLLSQEDQQKNIQQFLRKKQEFLRNFDDNFPLNDEFSEREDQTQFNYVDKRYNMNVAGSQDNMSTKNTNNTQNQNQNSKQFMTPLTSPNNKLKKNPFIKKQIEKLVTINNKDSQQVLTNQNRQQTTTRGDTQMGDEEELNPNENLESHRQKRIVRQNSKNILQHIEFNKENNINNLAGKQNQLNKFKEQNQENQYVQQILEQTADFDFEQGNFQNKQNIIQLDPKTIQTNRESHQEQETEFNNLQFSQKQQEMVLTEMEEGEQQISEKVQIHISGEKSVQLVQNQFSSQKITHYQNQSWNKNQSQYENGQNQLNQIIKKKNENLEQSAKNTVFLDESQISENFNFSKEELEFIDLEDKVEKGLKYLWEFKFQKAENIFEGMRNRNLNFQVFKLEINFLKILVSGVQSLVVLSLKEIDQFIETAQSKHNVNGVSKVDLDLIFCEIYLIRGLFQGILQEKFQGFLSLRQSYSYFKKIQNLNKKDILTKFSKSRYLFVQIPPKPDKNLGLKFLKECAENEGIRSNYAGLILAINFVQLKPDVKEAISIIKLMITKNKQSPLFQWMGALLSWRNSKHQQAQDMINLSLQFTRNFQKKCYLLYFEKGWFYISKLQWGIALRNVEKLAKVGFGFDNFDLQLFYKICKQKNLIFGEQDNINININNNKNKNKEVSLHKQQLQNEIDVQYLNYLCEEGVKNKEDKIIFPHRCATALIIASCYFERDEVQKGFLYLGICFYLQQKFPETKSAVDDEMCRVLSKVIQFAGNNIFFKYEILYFVNEVGKLEDQEIEKIQAELQIFYQKIFDEKDKKLKENQNKNEKQYKYNYQSLNQSLEQYIQNLLVKNQDESLEEREIFENCQEIYNVISSLLFSIICNNILRKRDKVYEFTKNLMIFHNFKGKFKNQIEKSVNHLIQHALYWGGYTFQQEQQWEKALEIYGYAKEYKKVEKQKSQTTKSKMQSSRSIYSVNDPQQPFIKSSDDNYELQENFQSEYLLSSSRKLHNQNIEMEENYKNQKKNGKYFKSNQEFKIGTPPCKQNISPEQQQNKGEAKNMAKNALNQDFQKQDDKKLNQKQNNEKKQKQNQKEQNQNERQLKIQQENLVIEGGIQIQKDVQIKKQEQQLLKKENEFKNQRSLYQQNRKFLEQQKQSLQRKFSVQKENGKNFKKKVNQNQNLNYSKNKNIYESGKYIKNNNFNNKLQNFDQDQIQNQNQKSRNFQQELELSEQKQGQSDFSQQKSDKNNQNDIKQQEIWGKQNLTGFQKFKYSKYVLDKETLELRGVEELDNKNNNYNNIKNNNLLNNQNQNSKNNNNQNQIIQQEQGDLESEDELEKIQYIESVKKKPSETIIDLFQKQSKSEKNREFSDIQQRNQENQQQNQPQQYQQSQNQYLKDSNSLDKQFIENIKLYESIEHKKNEKLIDCNENQIQKDELNKQNIQIQSDQNLLYPSIKIRNREKTLENFHFSQQNYQNINENQRYIFENEKCNEFLHENDFLEEEKKKKMKILINLQMRMDIRSEGNDELFKNILKSSVQNFEGNNFENNNNKNENQKIDKENYKSLNFSQQMELSPGYNLFISQKIGSQVMGSSNYQQKKKEFNELMSSNMEENQNKKEKNWFKKNTIYSHKSSETMQAQKFQRRISKQRQLSNLYEDFNIQDFKLLQYFVDLKKMINTKELADFHLNQVNREKTVKAGPNCFIGLETDQVDKRAKNIWHQFLNDNE